MEEVATKDERTVPLPESYPMTSVYNSQPHSHIFVANVQRNVVSIRRIPTLKQCFTQMNRESILCNNWWSQYAVLHRHSTNSGLSGSPEVAEER